MSRNKIAENNVVIKPIDKVTAKPFTDLNQIQTILLMQLML